MSIRSRRVIQGLLRVRFSYHLISPSNGESFSSIRDPIARNSSTSDFTTHIHSKLLPNFMSSNRGSSQILYPPQLTTGTFTSRSKNLYLPKLDEKSLASGIRFLSSKMPDSGGETGGNFSKKIFDKSATALSSAFSRYREAIELQIEAFCKRNYLFLLGAGGIVVCMLLWRIMFGIANTFVGISEGLAKYGFLALSSAIVAFSGLYVRSRFIINPNKVYRMAMRKLNTSAGILEVMGAPLTGSDLRAYVMSGGGLTLKNFKPDLRSKRCFLIFPISGSERKGLVSIEVKKKKGQYDMKLLAVDIPMGSGPDQRIFLIGDEEEYKVGGGLISELRDPVVKAMTATKEFDNLDQIEQERDEERELQEAERKRSEDIEKLEKGG